MVMITVALQRVNMEFVQVRSAFLMVSESTGRSKGYGLIKYLSNEAAAQARQLMDNRDLEGFCLQVRS